MKSLLRLLAAALLVPCLIQPASAQPTAPAVPASSPGLQFDVLSDTGGVNLAPYIKSLISSLKHQWSSQAASENQPSAKPEEAVITLTIAPNGQISQMKIEKIENPTPDSSLDRAAWNAMKTVSFSPPPAGMTDPNLKLRVHFTVN